MRGDMMAERELCPMCLVREKIRNSRLLRHIRNARREFWLAGRALIDARLERLKPEPPAQARPEPIKPTPGAGSTP